MNKNIVSKIGLAKRKSAFAIGALPYRMQIIMPTVKSSNGRIAMRDSDFEDRCGYCTTYRDFMMHFFKYSNKMKVQEQSSSGLRIEFNEKEQKYKDELRFIIRAGRYGYSSQLQNVKDFKVVKNREADDCELLPFCCRMVFNSEQDSAIVIFEKFGVNSAVTIFKEALRDYVKKVGFGVDSSYDIALMAITNKRYLEDKFSNSVKAIHLVRHAKIGDLADLVHSENAKEERVKVQMSIMADRGGILKLLDRLNPLKSDNFIGVEIDNQKYDDIRLELKAGRRTQTVSFDADMFSIAFDLTDMVPVNEDGHPDYEIFFEKTEKCLKMSKETIGW